MDTLNREESAKAPPFHIVLVSPEIPGNTGSIGRTCLALGAHLHLIHPLGFELTEKSIRRAGLDYWKYIRIYEYKSFEEFLESISPSALLFFSAGQGKKDFYKAPYQENCALIFGSESRGLSKELLKKYDSKERGPYFLPLLNSKVRSLNLASTVTAASYEALRQIKNYKSFQPET